MEARRRLMVVGASPGNLGMRVIGEAMRSRMWQHIRGYDINGSVRAVASSIQYMDVTNREQVVRELEDLSPTDIVCTVGTNHNEGFLHLVPQSLQVHMNVNLFGPMLLLVEALDMWQRWSGGDSASRSAIPETGFNFSVVSSNSAHIARSQSAGYCASKAALSMAIRCVARREAEHDATIWAYEPGFIVGTPMSQKTQDQFPDVPLHRIPGERTVDADDLAMQIVSDMINAHDHFNGCTFRLDGGEQ